MAIAYITDDAYANGNPVSLAMPAGVVQGNLMIAFVAVQDDNGLSSVNTLAGWNFIGKVSSSAGSYVNLSAFWRIAGSGEAGPYSWTATAGSGSNIGGLDGMIWAFSGTAQTAPINNFAIKVGPNTSTTIIIPALTETFQSGEWYIACVCDSNNTSYTSTTPTCTYYDATGGFWESFNIGAYAPVSSAAAMTWTTTGTWSSAAVGIAVSILPPGTGASVIPPSTQIIFM